MQLDLFSLEDKYPDGEVKECRMCGIKKPMTHAYFAIDRHSSKGKPFYRTACRVCERNKRVETEEIKEIHHHLKTECVTVVVKKYRKMKH